MGEKAEKVFNPTVVSKLIPVATRTAKRVMELGNVYAKIQDTITNTGANAAKIVRSELTGKGLTKKEEGLIRLAISYRVTPGSLFGSAKSIYNWFVQRLPDLKDNGELVQKKCTEASKSLLEPITGYATTAISAWSTFNIADRMAYWILGEEAYNGKGCLGKCSGGCKDVAPVKLEKLNPKPAGVYPVQRPRKTIMIVCNECHEAWIPPCSNKERNHATRRCKKCDGEWHNSLFDELRDTPKDIVNAGKYAWNALRSKPVYWTDDMDHVAPKVVKDAADPPKSAGFFGTISNWCNSAKSKESNWWNSVPNTTV